MNVSRKMDRTLTVNRVPAGRIGAAEELCFQADAGDRLLHGKVQYLLRGLPGRPAGCAPHHIDPNQFFTGCLDGKFRCPEFPAVFSQTVLPGETASGGRAKHPRDAVFFTRGHHRDALMGTQPGQVLGEIRVG